METNTWEEAGILYATFSVFVCSAKTSFKSAITIFLSFWRETVNVLLSINIKVLISDCVCLPSEGGTRLVPICVPNTACQT
jgi:hypothetical protein